MSNGTHDPADKDEYNRRAANSAPELVIGLVGAIGTDLTAVAKALSTALMAEANYDPRTIRLSSLLHEIEGLETRLSSHGDKHLYYKEHMQAGTELRRKMGCADAMAWLALSALRAERNEMLKAERRSTRRAFILHSLKRREEIESLRKIYGPAFFLLSAYAPRDKRVDKLSRSISESRGLWRPMELRSEAEDLVRTDERDMGEPMGQDVQRAFPEADVFIDATNPKEMEHSIQRFVRLIFGHPFHTPTRSEWGIFFAKAAAMRSAALGRQVGSAIASPSGELIAVGTNEVPKAGGGLYWEGDEPDGRDFVGGEDTSDRHKHDLISELLRLLQEKQWLAESYRELDVQKLREWVLHKKTGPWSDSRVMNLIEFMRPVHAEMAALMEAARRGVSVQGGVMYVTTFPCHECARHIIAAGISRVVYIDPYPKSLAAGLYSDSIALEGSEGGSTGKVIFSPFVGIAPRRYMEFFELKGERKDQSGSVLAWVPTKVVPKHPGNYTVYNSLEIEHLARFGSIVESIGLKLRGAVQPREEEASEKAGMAQSADR
ncbi:anti-phage dCTP deaminase [Hyalangium gracile]|uniref:anti-phage dCTP deaminase n=1 Tax=Hyalangium gracile TaxID=394092 RepID=UPI001CC92718|nr:anti-phage dCTP deaminase [Hyalangium gracile]